MQLSLYNHRPRLIHSFYHNRPQHPIDCTRPTQNRQDSRTITTDTNISYPTRVGYPLFSKHLRSRERDSMFLMKRTNPDATPEHKIGEQERDPRPRHFTEGGPLEQEVGVLFLLSIPHFFCFWGNNISWLGYFSYPSCYTPIRKILGLRVNLFLFPNSSYSAPRLEACVCCVLLFIERERDKSFFELIYCALIYTCVNTLRVK